MSNIPSGFVPHRFLRPEPFLESFGPFHVHRGGDRPRIGLRVEHRHCNPNGSAHGGLISSLSDILTAYAIFDACHPVVPRLATISLNVDFLGAPPLGCWLDGWGEVQRMGGSIVFSRCELFADGTLAARASGVFRKWDPA